MKKTDFNTLTTSVDAAEPKHYERSLLNCDVSGTETPVPLQEGAPVKVGVLCSSKHLDLPDVTFKNLSDPGLQPQKISDNLHYLLIEAEHSNLENLLKIMQTVTRI
jgi:hypothetical protein